MSLKYAGLYKVIMNCSTLLQGYYILTRRQPEVAGSERWRSECLCVSVYVYFPQCMGAALRDDAGQRVGLVSIRPGKGSAVCVCQPSCLFKTTTITARKDRIHVLIYMSPRLLCLRQERPSKLALITLISLPAQRRSQVLLVWG